MKKGLLVLLSILLIAASIFGLFAGVKGVKEALNVAEYKADQGNAGLYAILHSDQDITDRDLYPVIDESKPEDPNWNTSLRGGCEDRQSLRRKVALQSRNLRRRDPDSARAEDPSGTSRRFLSQ